MHTFTLVLVAACFIAAVSAFPAEAEEPKLDLINPVAAAETEHGDAEVTSGDRAKRQYYGGYGGYGGGYNRGYGGYNRGYGGYRHYRRGHRGYRGGYGGGYGGGYNRGYGGYGFYG